MQLFRKIFFYIFAVIYLVLCPLVILYAFGFVFRPGMQEGMVKTGIIYVATAPSGATIYMNNTRFTKTAPAVIWELLPGNYSIKVDLKDYLIWEETVPVEAEKATVLDNILLLPREWESETLLTEEYQEMVPIPGTSLLILKKGDKLKDVLVGDHEKGEAWPLVEEGSPFEELKLRAYFLMQESAAVFVQALSLEGEKFLWIELQEKQNTVKDITGLIQSPPEHVEWTADMTHLFVYRDEQLDRVDVSSGAVYPEYFQGIRGFGLSNGDVYVLKGDNTLMRTDIDKKSSNMLLDDPELGRTIFTEKEFYKIRALNGNIILFIGKDGQLLANRLPYRFVDKGLRGFDYYPQLERVLVWTKDKIGILDFSAEKTGNTGFEKGPALIWVYTRGKNIEQAFWVYEASHILFRDGDEIFLLTLDAYGEFKLDQVFKVKKSDILYSDQNGKMYFLSRTNGEFLSVEIVPVGKIISVPLPEMKEIKKKKIEELWDSSSQPTT
ncbi:MAG: PEGA domain-containing protein [Candidatus Omnitrophota bacterium]